MAAKALEIGVGVTFLINKRGATRRKSYSLWLNRGCEAIHTLSADDSESLGCEAIACSRGLRRNSMSLALENTSHNIEDSRFRC
jgi:hypothetical protein